MNNSTSLVDKHPFFIIRLLINDSIDSLDTKQYRYIMLHNKKYNYDLFTNYHRK